MGLTSMVAEFGFPKPDQGSQDQGQSSMVVEGTGSGEVAITTEAMIEAMIEDRGTSNLKFILKHQKIQTKNKKQGQAKAIKRN